MVDDDEFWQPSGKASYRRRLQERIAETKDQLASTRYEDFASVRAAQGYIAGVQDALALLTNVVLDED
jgi:hypothetical protein